MVPLNDGNFRLTIPVVEELCARDPLILTFDIFYQNQIYLQYILKTKLKYYGVAFDTNGLSNNAKNYASDWPVHWQFISSPSCII